MDMTQILSRIAIFAAALALPASAHAGSIEGKWKSAKGTMIVNVAPCGNSHCGTVIWAAERHRKKGVTIGARVLTNLHAVGDGVYKGRAFDPRHKISGQATIRQAGPNAMIVRGCAIAGVICKENRWTRVG